MPGLHPALACLMVSFHQQEPDTRQLIEWPLAGSVLNGTIFAQCLFYGNKRVPAQRQGKAGPQKAKKAL